MPGWAKALIIVGVLIVLLVVGVIAAGVFWWSRNKDALIARGKAQMTEGRTAGLSTDNRGCVDKSVARYKADPGFAGTIAANLFMQSCLEASQATPGFCDGVPRVIEIMKSSQWSLEQCRLVDLSRDQYCPQLFGPVQQFCEKPRPSSEPSTSN
jgi:hypothetical protein